MSWRFLTWTAVLALACAAPLPAQAPRTPSPEDRALAYLAVEVPRWPVENKCYSCHNNGDAARALFAARRAGRKVPAKATEDTLRWLASPAKWDDNGGDPRFSDKNLARLQFAHALLGALDAELLKDKGELAKAAELVAEHQGKDGSWQIDLDGPGTPATYGAALATLTARRILHRADATRYRDTIARADGWLRALPAKSVIEAAVLLRVLAGAKDEDAVRRRKECLDVLTKGQGKDGGWGPFVQSPSSVFDTALVVLSLKEAGGEDGKAMLQRGRNYLLATQEKDGSWPETVRATGQDSYAQKLSTTGWATLALLATSEGP